ncbi:hypothetical protein C5471_15790 [Photorhabdus tasmaniensis]|uniref:Uncharacterized protein n=1 Tax=Photorhabdus tasmaniensis TaxID=1004159 RepID=A0ABX0GLC2_9GAMM|nr:hypothetical protein [Photorhabdus tasmaniensis]
MRKTVYRYGFDILPDLKTITVGTNVLDICIVIRGKGKPAIFLVNISHLTAGIFNKLIQVPLFG